MYLSYMKSVPIKDLKRNLSSWTEEAAKGERVQVTKYNRPYVVLSPAGATGIHVGKKVGKEPLKSVLKEATKGRWLRALQEDRDED